MVNLKTLTLNIILIMKEIMKKIKLLFLKVKKIRHQSKDVKNTSKRQCRCI